jgi:hypothetical protein
MNGDDFAKHVSWMSEKEIHELITSVLEKELKALDDFQEPPPTAPTLCDVLLRTGRRTYIHNFERGSYGCAVFDLKNGGVEFARVCITSEDFPSGQETFEWFERIEGDLGFKHGTIMTRVPIYYRHNDQDEGVILTWA